MPSAWGSAAVLALASAAYSSTFSTILGGPGIEVTAAGASCSEGSRSEILVFVRDWDTFGDPWLVELGPDGGIDLVSGPGSGIPVSRELESGGRVVSLEDGSLLISAQGEPRATGRDADACVMKVVPGEGTSWWVVIGEKDDGVYNIQGLAAFDDGSSVVAGNEGCGEFTPFASIYDPDGRQIRTLDVDDSLYVVGADVTEDGQALLATFTMYEMRIQLLWFSRDGRLLRRASPFVDAGFASDPGVFTVLASGSGRIYLTGYLEEKPWIGCLSADGSLLWDDALDAVGRIAAVADAGDGRVVCCGSSSGGSAVASALAAEYDPDGVPLWAWLYENGETSNFEDVAVAPDGELLFAGFRDLGNVDPLWREAWIVRTDEAGLVRSQVPDGFYPETIVVTPASTYQSMTDPGRGWVVACGVFDTPGEASLSATYAADATGLRPGILWIPDFPSLSGYQGWLAYLVPEEVDGPGWAELAEGLLVGWPDAYLVWIGDAGDRASRQLVVDREEAGP